MRDILLASGPIYFLILTIVVIIILLGFLFKRATRRKYNDVKVNIYDPEKEAAEKARKAQLAEAAKKVEAPAETAEAGTAEQTPESSAEDISAKSEGKNE